MFTSYFFIAPYRRFSIIYCKSYRLISYTLGINVQYYSLYKGYKISVSAVRACLSLPCLPVACLLGYT